MRSVHSISEDDLLQIVRAGPFHVALQAAIQARGLSLETLRRRLGEDGSSVSLACLSHWQRGRTKPERAVSLSAVRRLEAILELPRHSLLTLLQPKVQRSAPRVPLDRLCKAPSVGVLVDGIRPRTEHQLTGLSLHNQYLFGRNRQLREVRHRVVFQARRRGADRWVAVYHHQHGLLPAARHAEGCRFGRTRVDERAGVIAAELLFDRPLARGETYLLEYTFYFEEFGPPLTDEGRAFRIPMHQFLLEMRFDAAAPPTRCHRVWRPDGRSELQDVSALRLSQYNSVHFVDFRVAAGYHGIRWEWE